MFLLNTSRFILPSPLMVDLKAYYALSDNQDSFGAYHLTNKNTPTYEAGLIGSCMNNSGGSLMGATIVTPNTTAISFSFWIKVSSVGLVAGNSRYAFMFGSQNTSHFSCVAKGTSTVGIYKIAIERTFTGTQMGSYETDVWRHFVIVKPDSATLTGCLIYTNGSLVTNTNTDATIIAPTLGSDLLNLGADWNGSGRGASLLDEFAIWQREVTAGEVAQLYNGGAGLSLSNF